jgi:hypothetical protein
VTSQLRIRTHNLLNLVDRTPSNDFFANRSFITITTTPQPNNKNARLAVGHHCNSKDDWQWSWFTSLWRGITLQREQQQQSLRATAPTAAAANANAAAAVATAKQTPPMWSESASTNSRHHQ